MSRVNFTLSFDNTKENEIVIINAIKKYSASCYMSQNAVIKMILRIALVDMNLSDARLSDYTYSQAKDTFLDKESNSIDNPNINNLISNSLTSLLK